MTKRYNNNESGFTLIRLFIIIGILMIFSAMTIVVIDPGRQFSMTRNDQRRDDVGIISDIIRQRNVDSQKSSECVADQLPENLTVIKSSGGYDMCPCFVPTRLDKMPYDPQKGFYSSCADYDSGYRIMRDSSGKVTVDAPGAEIEEVITLTR